MRRRGSPSLISSVTLRAFPPHIEIFKKIWAGDLAGADSPYGALIRHAAQATIVDPPGKRCVYSDLGYILAGAMIERAAGSRLDDLFCQLIAEPLDLRATGFANLALNEKIPDAAPTEICERRGRVIGEVHDENAHSSGGVCGHAGLFSTANDLSRIARVLLTIFSGETIAEIQPDTLHHFFRTCAASSGSWRLGWDTPSPLPEVSHAGELWPLSGVGHLGFTGCSLWLAPQHQCFAILLTNRVYFGRDQTKDKIKALRRKLMDQISMDLGIAQKRES